MLLIIREGKVTEFAVIEITQGKGTGLLGQNRVILQKFLIIPMDESFVKTVLSEYIAKRELLLNLYY